MKKSLLSAMKHAGPAAVSACACALFLSCAFGDEDAVQSLFQETEDPLVVAVGNSALYASPSGMSWSINLLSEPSTLLYDVVWGGDRFVAVGNSMGLGGTFVSEDGVVWVGPAPLIYSLYSVARFKDLFVAAGSMSIHVSQDGFVWVMARGTETAEMRDLAVGHDRIVAVGGNGGMDGGRVYVSMDGRVWAGPVVINSVMNLYRVAYGNGTFVATTDSMRLFASPDGIAWVPIDGPFVMMISAIAFGNGRFIAIDQGFYTYSSVDGYVWTQIGYATTAGSIINELECCYGYFVGVGGNGITITSAEGLIWREQTIINGNPTLNGLGCRQ